MKQWVLLVMFAACQNDEFVELRDGDSTAIMASINNGEILAAQTVQGKLTNPAVQAYAEHMIQSHTAVNAAQAQLQQSEDLPAQPNAISSALDAMSATLRQQLQAEQAPGVDSVYISSQVRMHRQALVLIDCAVDPQTDDSDLQEFVRDTVRPGVQEHWQEARQLASTLGVSDVGPSSEIDCSDACEDDDELPTTLRASACRN